MKKRLSKQFLSLLLAAVLVCGLILPVQAAPAAVEPIAAESAAQTDPQNTAAEEAEGYESLPFVKIEAEAPEGLKEAQAEDESLMQEPHALSDVVRVSIVLNEPSTLDQGYSTQGIAENKSAMAYRDSLKAQQARVTAAIEKATGAPLDVQWNLTLAANIISANVTYGQLDAIRAVDGVKDVVPETRYEPAVVDTDEPADPNMATSGGQIGSPVAWANGYTGLGSRVGIIDTGIDNDHQSFSAAAFNYMLAYNAGLAGMEVEEYVASLGLLNAEGIEAVRDQLNAADFAAEDLYLNSKIPFAYNYIDKDIDTTHDNDTQGEHGSHVAGITGANRYVLTQDGTFANALPTVFVQGVAPDTQLLAMKVFGKGGGAYDSDYFAAVEDAIILGCDAVNLSLGTAAPGFTYNATYQALLDRLTETDLVMVTSAGNSAAWSTNLSNGIPYLFGDDVNFDTAGSPGSYPNTLTVASVDNDGNTGHYLTLGDDLVFYNETNYSNAPFTTLAGEQEYVFIDGLGTDDDWWLLIDDFYDTYGNDNEIWDVSEILSGKIAVCSRGSITFSEKANIAAYYGAAGVIIYNNQAGVINMDLSDYQYDVPVVSITQADGALLKANAVPMEGTAHAWIGTLTVTEDVQAVQYNNPYSTLSSFSSWGVPGNLTLKPEITAPGGSIYSVNGAVASGDAYEVMSGTSMAAPQVAGMVAVVGQYIEENGLAEKTGLSSRQLAQSLLMGTAVPMIEENSGSWYAVLGQGAGLANVGSAVTAKSYLLMGEDATASHADGKLKAELGDDPDRTGVYSFSFTATNFSETETAYTLAAELFTQDLFDYEGNTYLDTWTAPLAAEAAWTVDGTPFVPKAAVDCDLDDDGDTDADDARVILDYAVGKLTEIDPKADLDGDGAVTTYDAHLLLAGLHTEAFTLAPGRTAQITVTLTLTDETKADLDKRYPDGAYVEGYVFLEPVETADGAIEDAAQSIPVLAFYGNWTDPSMFENGTYTEYLYGSTEPQYFGNQKTNNLTYRYPGETATRWQIINPYLIESSYPEGLAAVNADSVLTSYKASLIRPAAATAILITDEAGRILYLSKPSGENFGAWYYTNDAVWQNLTQSFPIGRKLSALGVQEGDRVNVSLVAIPEYYTENGGITTEALTDLIETGTLGRGAYLTTTMTVDNTAPEVIDIAKSLLTNNLVITVRDNQHVSGVLITSLNGERVYSAYLPGRAAPGQAMMLSMDLSGVDVGRECIVKVVDYAGNAVSYRVQVDGSTEDYTGRVFAFSDLFFESGAFSNNNGVYELDPDSLFAYFQMIIMPPIPRLYYRDIGGATKVDETGQLDITAAEYVDGWVFMAAADGNLYVAQQGKWFDTAFVLRWSDAIEAADMCVDPLLIRTYGVSDMAYNYDDGLLYLLAASDSEINSIYTVDMKTGLMSHAFDVQISFPEGVSGNPVLANLAIDKNGAFYAYNNEQQGSDPNGWTGNAGNVYLYRWTASDVTDGAAVVDPVSESRTLFGVQFIGPMAWDHDAGVLYMAATAERDSPNALLVTVDPLTGTTEKTCNTCQYGEQYASRVGAPLKGLYIVPSGVIGTTIQQEEEASMVEICLHTTEPPLEQADVIINSLLNLEYTAYPWNLKDQTVTWSSTNPSVAEVDQNGTVHALSTGEAGITVTTNAEPHCTYTCSITVTETPEIAFTGLAVGDISRWTDFNAKTITEETNISQSAQVMVGGGLASDMVYAHDGATMYAVDPVTRETRALSTIASMWQWSDATVCPEPEGIFASQPLCAICNNGTYLELINPEAGSLGYFDLEDIFADDPLAALTHVEPEDRVFGTSGGVTLYVNYYFITESGELFMACVIDGFMARSIGNVGLDLSSVSNFNANASLIYDSATGLLVLATNAGPDGNKVYLINPYNLAVTDLGNVAEDVTALTCLYQYVPETEAPEDPEDPGAALAAPDWTVCSADGWITVDNLQYANLWEPAPAPEAAAGSTNSVVADAHIGHTEEKTDCRVASLLAMTDGDGALQSDAPVIEAGTVTLTLTAEADAANGKLLVSYDSHVLTLADVTSSLACTSFREGQEDVTLAWAEAEALPAGAALFTLTFTYDETADLDTVVTVEPLEQGETLTPGEPVEIPIKAALPDEHDCKIAHFDDVMEQYPYGTPEHEAIEWAYTHEPVQITSGTSETAFGVGKTLTRGQAATFLYAAAGRPEFDVSTAEKTFSDVPEGKYYTKAVLWAASEGLVDGYSDGTFKPNGTLTRGQILVILYAREGKPSVEGLENPYSDVAAGKWFTAAAIWAYHAGIEKGEDGVFGQATPCTREAFVLYLYRVMEGKALAE